MGMTLPPPPSPVGGEQHGGDGVRDGHVPVYYRHNDDFLPPTYRQRATEYTQMEMLHAIREAIQGGILMTNGLAGLVDAYVRTVAGANPVGGGGSSSQASSAMSALRMLPCTWEEQVRSTDLPE